MPCNTLRHLLFVCQGIAVHQENDALPRIPDIDAKNGHCAAKAVQTDPAETSFTHNRRGCDRSWVNAIGKMGFEAQAKVKR